MTVDELIKAAQAFEPTEADIQALVERIDEAEKKYLAEAEARKLPEGWLNKPFSSL